MTSFRAAVIANVRAHDALGRGWPRMTAPLCRHCGAAVDPSTAARTGGYCDGCQPALPGVDVHAQDRAAQDLTGEELSAQLRTPGKDVSGTAGKIERDAPLFFGTGENPSLF